MRRLWVIALLVAAGAVLAPAGSAAAAQGDLVELRIVVAPKLIGVPFLIDGRRFASHGDGVASITVAPGKHRLVALPWKDQDGLRRAVFSRWRDEVFTARRSIEIKHDTTLEVGMDTSFLLRFEFRGIEGRKVSPDRIESALLKNTLGTKTAFTGDETSQWLLGQRIVRRAEGLESVPVVYRVQSVLVDGANAVYAAQQAVTPDRGPVVSITLQLFTARFRSSDALFGLSTGSGVRLQFPDGHWRTYDFGDDGSVTLTGLPRGTYHAATIGGGYAPVSPVAMSKSQTVDLQTVSPLDVGVVSVVAVACALILLFVGRPDLLGRLRRGFARRRTRTESVTQ
jgi:hypothetical protein